MANVTETRQLKFKTAALMAMDTMKAAGLKKWAEKGQAKGGETYTFYRKNKAGAQDGLPSMYNQNSSSLGGDFKKFTATIEQISSQDKLAELDMLKTTIDLKSPIISSMANAVLQREDEKIVAKIVAKDTELKKMGTVSKAITDTANLKALMMAVRSAHVWAKNGLNQQKGVAIVMTEEDYTELATSELFINGDYEKAFRGGVGDVPLTFFGAEIVISEQLTKGTIYIIPSNTFGFAEWENSIKTDCEFHATDGRQWHLQISKSVGVVVIEPTKITKFSVKA